MMKMILKFRSPVSKFISFLKEDESNSSLEARVYHSLCYVSIIASFLSFFVNLYVDMDIVIWMSVFVFVLQSFCCYLSKVKRKLNLAIIISSIVFHIVLCINYIYNAGIAGPTLLLTTLTLFFLIVVEKKKAAILWFCLNIIVATGLLSMEFFYKDFVIVKYNARQDLFLDIYFTYLIIIASVYYSTLFLKKNYQEQRKHIIQKAIALEKLNTEKDKLFSIISHDLRMPLANVQQYLEMMEVVELTPEEKQTIEKDLLYVTRNAQDLLVNLLQWSRNQMEGVSVNQHSCNLLKEIEKTLANMQLIASKKGINLVINIDKECTVLADVDMLNLLIRNLVHNAIKFTSAGGLVEVGAKPTETSCEMYVKDTGQGIPLDLQQDLFTLKMKTTFGTDREKGTGIGLMLCKEYTEMQKGRIWFESKENVGTTFYLSFPNAKAVEKQI